MSSAHLRQITLWLVIIVIAIMLWQVFNVNQRAQQEINFTDFVRTVKSGEINEVTIIGNKIEGSYHGEIRGFKKFHTIAPDYDKLVDLLQENNVIIKAKEEKESTLLLALLNFLAVFWMGVKLLIDSAFYSWYSLGHVCGGVWALLVDKLTTDHSLAGT